LSGYSGYTPGYSGPSGLESPGIYPESPDLITTSTSFIPNSIQLGLDLCYLSLGMVRPRAGESLEDAEQRRQKRRHDPHTQREDAPRNPPRELRPRHRAGKEPAGSSSGKEPRKAPYIMQSRPAAPPSRPTPTSKGIAHDICPKTPPRLRVEYTSEQRNNPSVPRLH